MTDAALVPIGAEWALWPVTALRSAGWPARLVLELADTGTAAGAADRPASDGRASAGRASDRLAAIVRTPRFREAVTWQNLPLMSNWLADYAARLAHGPAPLRHRRKREIQLARYVQRYTVKNDTIGFFGPIAWGRLAPDDPGVVSVHGGGAEASRSVHFEAWAIERLARRWSGDPDIRAHLCPTRDPSAVLLPDRLVLPRRRPVRLDAEEHAVLLHCDGRSTPEQVLRRVRESHPALGFASVLEIRSILARLVERGGARWTLDLPLDDLMETALADRLRALPDSPARTRYLDRLAALDRRRRHLATTRAPEELAERLTGLTTLVEELTAAPAWHGKLTRPDGRGVVWMDTVVDRDVRLGGGAIAELARPLELLLRCCRWITWRVAEETRAAAAAVLGREGSRLPVAMLLAELAPELSPRSSGLLTRVVRELQARVAKILGAGSGEREQRVRSGTIADAWTDAFGAPGPGWTAARIHSPDVMLAAAGEDAANRGDFRWVIGEIHVAVNTLDNRVFVRNQAHPGQIEALVARTFDHGRRFVPAFPTHWPGISARGYPPLTVDVPDRFVYWSLEPQDVLPADVPRIPVARLEAVARDGDVVVVDHHGDPVAPFVEFIGELLSFLVGNAFHPFAPAPYTPRVVIDRVVVNRETWRLTAARMLTGVPAAGGERRLVANLRAGGLCRFVFVWVPGERKPVFCDLDSGLLVGNVLRLVRRLPPEAEVRFQEMLPDFGGLWLCDPRRDRYTSEFRMVAVDGRPGAVT
ncbi:lantibiotic dehydratase [Virgisporangium aurantiacum]|uniref:Lantibiotic dehydratase n=1 Tax=Virgisporangium aurantiacum TaxID=175570 RepID=A0A8J3ZHY0_9ACTN|nr:lantibiotic dehydratase [Virgisporangium aurantiacum]GIJ62220.1 lantibiotic dehydratase [Virgisporangium aurantiacum]